MKSLNQFVEGQEKSFGNFIIGQETTRGEFKRTLAEIELSNEEHQQALQKINAETRQEVLADIEALKVTNKKNYNNLNQSLRRKLADTKTDIQGFLETERMETRALVETELAKQNIQLSKEQDKLFTVLKVIALLLVLVLVGLVFLFFR